MSCVVALAILATTAFDVATFGQFEFHGITHRVECPEVCVGEAASCETSAENADDFGDTILVLQAWHELETAEGPLRVPPVGGFTEFEIVPGTNAAYFPGLGWLVATPTALSPTSRPADMIWKRAVDTPGNAKRRLA